MQTCGYNEINLDSRICEGYVYIIIEQGNKYVIRKVTIKISYNACYINVKP
jgi:hypothetical protein